MSDFFDRVVTRALGRRPALDPRISSRYAPPEHRLAAPDVVAPPDTAETGVAPLAAAEGSAAVEAGQGRATTPGPASDERGQVRLEASDSLPSLERAPTLAPASLRGPREDEWAPTGAAADLPRRARETQAHPVGRAPAGAAESIQRAPGASHTTAGALAPRDRQLGDDRSRPPLLERGAARQAVAAAPQSSPPATGQLEDAFWKFLYGSSDESSDASPAAIAPSFPGGPDGGAPIGAHSPQPVLGSAGWDTGAGRRNGADPTETSNAPEITIAIDRIDVRGLAPAPQAPAAAPARRCPRLSLEEYMRQTGSATAKR